MEEEVPESVPLMSVGFDDRIPVVDPVVTLSSKSECLVVFLPERDIGRRSERVPCPLVKTVGPSSVAMGFGADLFHANFSRQDS